MSADDPARYTMRRYTIESTVTDQIAHGVDSTEVADAIRHWYPEPPEDVARALDDLQSAVSRGEPYDELEAFLGLRVARA